MRRAPELPTREGFDDWPQLRTAWRHRLALLEELAAAVSDCIDGPDEEEAFAVLYGPGLLEEAIMGIEWMAVENFLAKVGPPDEE